MDSFAVRFGLETPLELRGLLHFDALLGSLAYSRGLTLADIPLAKNGEVWHGTAALLETGPFGLLASNPVRVKRIVPDSVTPGLFDHLKGSERRISQMSPMRAMLTLHSCFDGVRAVWFAGHGNIDQASDLLADVRNLGCMGRSGYGRVTGFETLPAGGHRLFGIATPDGQPMRAVRMEDWEGFGLPRPSDAVVSLQRFAPPYWDGPKAPCILPLQASLSGTSGEIRRMLQVA